MKAPRTVYEPVKGAPAQPLTYTLQVEAKDEGREVKSLLRSKLMVSTRLVRQLPGQGQVLRNDRPVRLTDRVAKGDIIRIMLPMESSDVEPITMVLDVRYEDDEIVVVNKPSGVLTHPTARERTGSLQSGLAAYLQPQGRVAHCVHRLDRDTSGLVLFAKHAHVHHLFDEALRRGGVHRVYAAIVEITPDSVERGDLNLAALAGSPGKVDAVSSAWHSVELPIGLDPDKPSRRVVDASGQLARTDFRVVSVVESPVGTDGARQFALVQLVLWTGRTHQIRLHMASVGLPLVGDPDYGVSRRSPVVVAGLKRQALHAVQLGWKHPLTSSLHHVSALPPADLVTVWRRIGGDESGWQTLVADQTALRRVRIV